jgi:small subunit ribosomal protein S11
MSEDKKDLKVENNTEELKKDSASPVSLPAENINSVDLDSGDDEVDNLLGKGEAGEELPDEIKKKLESRKEEKAGKKVFKKKKKHAKVRTESGKVFVKASYNNTIVTVTDLNGNVLSWASAGMAGFKGPKKATSYAAQIITKIALMKAKEDYGLKEVSVYINGIGTGREAAVRAVNANNINVTAIRDITPIPHNGCRPRKPRRV